MKQTPLWQAEAILHAVRGQSLHDQDWTANGVAIDSRTVKPGDLFIAIKGENHDGHDHVAAAFNNGAAAAIVSRQPSQVAASSPLIFVDDTFVALQELGKAGRERSAATIIGVTGSVGKTGTKEMLRLMLGTAGETYANEGGLNNHWGAPLSLARLPNSAQYGVFEMGMNHAGEMAHLTALVRPHIALITTVEAAHLEFFASVEAIADAKAEIFQGMPHDGIAILNHDNPHYARLATAAKHCGLRKIMSFGTGKCDARLIEASPTAEGSRITADILGRKHTYILGAPGLHMAKNSLGALLIAVSASGDAETCAAALADYHPPKGRGAWQTISLPGGTFTLIDESYNASPVAVRAAIQVLGQSTVTAGGRRILVLGDMREMGATSPDLHAALATPISEAKIDLVFCCGEMMRHLFDALPAPLRGGYASDSAGLAPLVVAAVHLHDFVTVKGSKSMLMGRIAEVFKNHDLACKKAC